MSTPRISIIMGDGGLDAARRYIMRCVCPFAVHLPMSKDVSNNHERRLYQLSDFDILGQAFLRLCADIQLEYGVVRAAKL